ncbi:hypothetical protein GALL_327720 [mine drainage metagenome]|uniref:Uncharacterized protein n=1 Tax=mine drainage metagenome TaxID=410659 RepID=A0A1J5QPS6_9ZZZZ
MKRQYLGDSKDSFKWDYHHFLVEELGYDQLKVAWMMTPDDHGSDGKTSPELFPARPEMLAFCNRLRSCREPSLLSEMPATTGAGYSVSFHKPEHHLDGNNRASYFSTIKLEPAQVLFLDPDNGFEPERSFSEKHVRYAEIENIINGAPSNSVVTVFQHHRRKKFPEDFARIRERLRIGYTTAIYGHSLMFVSISSSAETISHVNKINREYARNHPVEVLA